MEVVKFGDIAELIQDRITPKENNVGNYIGLENLPSESLLVTSWQSDVVPDSDKFLFKKGDVLFARRRAYQKKVGVAPFDGIISTDGMVFRPKSCICESILPFIVKSDHFMNYAINNSAGTMSPRVKWKDLQNCEIKIPNKELQKTYSNLLWNLEKTIMLLNERLIILDQLVKSRFIEMFGNPINNEMQWPTEKMKEVAPSVQADNKPLVDGNWLLNLDAIQSNTGDILFKNKVSDLELNGSIIAFSSNHVLYSKLRPYLNKVVLPDESGYGTTELIPLLPDMEKITRTYLAHLLRSDAFVSKFSSAVAGTKMPRVSMDVFWKFEVPIPPIELQHEYGKFVEQVDKSKFELQRHLDDTKRLQKALIDQAFNPESVQN